MTNKIFGKTSYSAKHWTRFLIIPAILLLSSCYYPQEQIVTHPPQNDNVPLLRKFIFIRPGDNPRNNNRAIIMSVITGR